MHKRFRATQHRLLLFFENMFLGSNPSAGKITLITTLVVALVTTSTLAAYFQILVPYANADNVSTSLTVLNTPPSWTVDAEESIESSTSTPTNAGQLLVFVGTATDSSNDNYWLLVCSASSTPTANNGAPPTCGSGIMWARSATTTSGTQASAATTTIETAPFNAESNNWYAYVCDGNATGAQCNPIMKNGSGTTVSPFVINHPPVFSLISNDTPANPGETVTWTSTASDADTIRGGDTVRLTVCKAADYATTTSSCGAGGTWAQSTLAASDPATTTTIVIPTQDKTYDAYVYVSDNNNAAATSTNQGFNSSFVVSNVAPSVLGSGVSIVDGIDGGRINLVTPSSTSGPFTVQFTVVDNNSCLNSSSGNEISSATTSIYRSGVGQASCQTSAHYDTNACYPSANPQTLISCVQDVGSCSGSSDSDSTWTCTFSLWYNADPTYTSSFYSGEDWKASVQVTDDNSALSPISESTTGNEVENFMAFDVTQTAIAYGGLQPGQDSGTLSTSTDLIATGNVGLDEDLYGDTMCTNWTGFDSCDAGGINTSTEIAIGNQKAGTSSVAFASSFAYTMTASTTPLEVLIGVKKTVATSSQQTKNTWWGINVPSSITLAGSYTGRNVITAKTSDSAFWY